MVGAAGNVILFVCVGVGFVILGGFTLAFAAHCYLVIVQGTTAGIDRVDWPNEPVHDWLGQVVWLGGLLACWMVPLGLIARGLSDPTAPEQTLIQTSLILGGGLWLAVPISLLSALATSYWTPISPRVILHLFRLAGSVLLFYFIAGVLLALTIPLVNFALFTKPWIFVLLATLSLAYTMMIHARLVGRLAWQLSQLEGRAKKSSQLKQTKRKRKPAQKRSRAVEVEDPWAIDEEEEFTSENANEGYIVVEESREKAPRPRPAYLDPEPEPYTMSDEPTEESGQRKEEKISPVDQAKVERELQLRTRVPPNPPPTYPMVEGVFTFPFYDTSLKYTIALGFWLLLSIATLRMLILLWPF